jgi:uncharacterized protein YutE (UPF0331/DUF86 family)
MLYSYDIADEVMNEIEDQYEKCRDNKDRFCKISIPLYKGAYDLLMAAQALIDLYNMLKDAGYHYDIDADGVLIIDIDE